ncbi:hypothetical protein H072_1968 [Dactylellina haptotyla CBS 200.50]|uniref:Geranylgeranyl pyrophosphate synthetase n=1 Tax=Dactylellina haptotyla (strain CBS 200.50) TaxID=1284197 RepID=S8AMF3_DACHA|nr:hypothetical protein H072_1968 [Dactylellina haptotyla CBS 200.50]
MSTWRGASSSGRAGFAPRGGRGGGRGRGGRGGHQSAPLQPDIVKHPLGDLVAKITTKDIDPTGSEDTFSAAAVITDCEYVASYNWMNEGASTIMAPGKPPLWTPLSVPRRLNEDTGDFYRDPNAARFPSYPIEPAVQAIFKVDAAFSTSNIDVFACGSTLGNLLRFARHDDKPFRFGVELIGNTVFFVRKEGSPTELIAGVRGWGHTFPEAYTTWEPDVKGSETHQRMVQYKFGGLRFILRFECDGYFNTALPQKTSPDGDDDLAQALKTVSVSQSLPKQDNSLSIKTGGSEVPQSSIFDLKTRSGKRGQSIDMEQILPLLYLKQIPNFIVAYHNGAGLFPTKDIKVENFEKEIRQWEVDNKCALERLSVIIRKIIEVVKMDECGLLEIYRPSPDCLEIRKQHGDESHVLPLSLRQEWEGAGLHVADEFDSDQESSQAGEGVDLRHSYNYNFDSDSDDDSIKDFTACSADDCGYCGKCTY